MAVGLILDGPQAEAILQAITTELVEAVLDGLMAIITLVVIFVLSPALASVVLIGAVLYALLRWALYTPLRQASMEAIVWDARQDTARAHVTGYRGFFYHFLDPSTGRRFETVELSTVDTALLLPGAGQSFPGRLHGLADMVIAAARGWSDAG